MTLSMEETSLEALATRISQNLKTLIEIESQTNVSHETKVPDDVRLALLDDCYEVQRRCTQPGDYLERLQMFSQQLSCLQWLCHFDVFQHIPVQGTVSFVDLATTANVPLIQLQSIARMAMTAGLLCEPEAGQVSHSALSAAAFGSAAPLLPWAKFITNFAAPTAMRMAEATQRWGEISRTDQTAYNIAFNTPLPFFQHLTESPGGTEIFAGYMRSLNEVGGTALKHLLTGYDWASLGEAHVIDVGGNKGHASVRLASHFPHLRFTVQDLPDVVEEASTAILDSSDPSIASRVNFMAHDFLTPQPADIAASADVYLLRRILHNWPSEPCKLILQHLANALKPGAIILVMDTILPPPGSIPAHQEALLRMRDLIMTQSFNSHERDLAQWMELLQSTTPRLRLKESIKPVGSQMSVSVVVREE